MQKHTGIKVHCLKEPHSSVWNKHGSLCLHVRLCGGEEKRMRPMVGWKRKSEGCPYIMWYQDYSLRLADDPEGIASEWVLTFQTGKYVVFILSYLACYVKKAYHMIQPYRMPIYKLLC